MRVLYFTAAVPFFLAQASLGQDVNGNLFADSFDLRQGTSQDCNHNGIPDEVESDRPHFSAAVEHLNALEGFMSDVWDASPIDFNQDGMPDIVTASMPDPNYGYVTFWRNEGGVGLTYVSRILMNNARPHFVRAADLNGDGKTDLAIGDDSWTRVHIFIATGSETFAPPVQVNGSASNNGLSGLAVADLDNDGDIDLAASLWGQNTINVWKNNGNGTFGAAASYPVGFAPRGIVVGDITGDGLKDIAVANSFESSGGVGQDGTVTLLRNDGSTFVTHATLVMPTNTGPFGIMRPRPQDVALSDVDHDNDLDLVVSSDDSNRLDLWSNNGSGTFTLVGAVGKGYYIGNEASAVICQDLDGDGWDEIAWLDSAAYDVSIFKNNQGTFSFRQSFSTGNMGSEAVTAADFDSDGKIDLAVANRTLRTFCILKNTGDLWFDAALRLRPSQYPSNSILTDFNNDGITDYGAPEQSQLGTIAFHAYLGAGDGTFGPAIVTTPFTSSSVIWARDVNEDGNIDLVATVGGLKTYPGNGDGTFQPPISSPPTVGVRNVITDINNDGHLDLTWIIPGHPGALWRSLGDGAGNFGPAVNVAVVPAEDQEIAFGDVTGDDIPEIFTGHKQGLQLTGGIFCTYPNNGDGTFGPRQDRFITGQPLNPAVAAIAIADFDTDGDNDAVVSANGLKMYANPGDGNWPTTPVQVAPQGGSILRVADINLDKIPDLYVRASNAGAFLNDGTGQFTKRMFLHFYDSNARGMVIGDVNNDGRTDVLIEPENSWDKYIYLNYEPITTDCDGDGIPDGCDTDKCAGGGIAGDCNDDGVVNVDDLIAVVNSWGICANPSQCPADMNADGKVNVDDLLIVINNWTV